MSRYFANYDELGEYRPSMFDPVAPAPRPFNQEAFNRLLDRVAEAGKQYGERCARQLSSGAAKAGRADR